MKNFFTGMLVIFTLLLCSNAFASELNWGYVNGGKLIESHPLMQQFDVQSRRFRDTLSQPRPSEDPAEYISRLQGKLNTMTNTIKKLDQNYGQKIIGNGLAAKKAYMMYWKKRESLRFYAELLKEAIAAAAIHGNFYLNTPSDWTVMPVVRGISSTVIEVCEHLRQKHKLLAVLDTSVFRLNDGASAGASVGLNQHWAIWRGEAEAISQMNAICSQVMFSVRSSFPDRANKPFVAGAVNLDSEAIEMLKNISMPSSSVPDDND